MRPILSYDDISLPAEAIHPSPPRPQHSQPPPLKKRRRPNQKPSNQQWPNIQHWDDPGNADETMLYDDIGSNGDAELSAVNDEGEIEGDESRELTYEEIWDDSALINAWNAATEEYEAYHGSDKNWKKEPVNKSPLWYNAPTSPSRLKNSKTVVSVVPASKPIASASREAKADTPDDSHPLNFDTFVPNHDPSLALPVPPYPSNLVDNSEGYLSTQPGPMVSQDEAFSRAMGAMYWAGYYSAIYHCQRNKQLMDDETEEGEHEENQNDEENEGLISTQR